MRETCKEYLPLGVQVVIDYSYEEFKYAIIEEHSTSLYDVNDDCYAVVLEESYDI